MSEPTETDPSDAPGPGTSDNPFVRFDTRLLDPTTAVRVPGRPIPTITAYVGTALLITADSRAEALAFIDRIRTLAGEVGLRVATPGPFDHIGDQPTELVTVEEENGDPESARRRVAEQDPVIAEHNRRVRVLAAAERTGTPLVFPIRLIPDTDRPAPAVDVWPLLQRVRATDDEALNRAVGLDHLMYSAPSILGNPFGPHGTALVGGDPFGPHGTSEGVASYASPGWGGHGPVAVVMGPPFRDPNAWRPRVVVLDTGVGKHPWFDADPVKRDLWVEGDPVGLNVNLPSVARTDPESAKPDSMTGELPSHAGHGTFISGLLRQICPEAHITTLRIMDGDGAVPEHALTDAVMALGTALATDPGCLQALVLSLGYYAETGDDLTYTAGLKALLRRLADRGVVTFAAAGNDSTVRPSYPAAFAATIKHPLPVMAVAALNPDETIALFSNDGHWVNAQARGANLVSTAPAEQGGNQAAVEFSGWGSRKRATIDPDDFRSGFAVWSGTSFAAPVLAGAYLAKLVNAGPNADVSQRRILVLELMRP